jgi:hypothetical protein
MDMTTGMIIHSRAGTMISASPSLLHHEQGFRPVAHLLRQINPRGQTASPWSPGIIWIMWGG